MKDNTRRNCAIGVVCFGALAFIVDDPVARFVAAAAIVIQLVILITYRADR